MSIKEECGVLGIFNPSRYWQGISASEVKFESEMPSDSLPHLAYYGLFALQHRGQESCGMVINSGGRFTSKKDLGLVSDVFTPDSLSALPEGHIVVGHVRYGTTGATNRNNCQPIEVACQGISLAVAHNGNLSNAAKLRSELELSGAIFHGTSDTETIAYLLARKCLENSSAEKALSEVMEIIEGAYSLIIMTEDKLICARDPYGFRPLCYGKTSDGLYVVSSETCGLHAVGAEFIRDVRPGEILVFSSAEANDGAEPNVPVSFTEHCRTKPKKTCIFEYIYFSRPDSEIDGISVHGSRLKAGQILAKVHPVNADVVIGVPDSGLDAAMGFSMYSGIPYDIGLIKNKYIGRTFISPGQGARENLVKIKLNVLHDVVKNKRVVLVDDSIVRGTTCSRIVKLLREAGAKEIHMRISAPPFLYPCYYGTDIDSQDNLIACKYSIKKITEIIGADSLGYLPVSELPALIDSKDFCSACFDGDYPTAISAAIHKCQFE